MLTMRPLEPVMNLPRMRMRQSFEPARDTNIHGLVFTQTSKLLIQM